MFHPRVSQIMYSAGVILSAVVYCTTGFISGMGNRTFIACLL